ncbi:hypothetical protein BDW74DRAFT_168808 [Aspergillus multicolor]|uniref:uncharacterized protein n=1 Tax=Aspergillus multicolor TaxID=41759 RepID=UPI003CCD6898
MDPLNFFPAEIIHKIIPHTADFVGIESLLTASPWVNAIKQLLRNVAIIYSPSTDCSSHDQYREMCYGPYGQSSGRKAPRPNDRRWIIADPPFTARIQRLACMCLHSMQQKFVSAVVNSQGPLVAERAAKPISWIEEFRVYWVLRHLQHYSAFVEASKDRWDWLEDYLKDIWTVSAILADMGLRPLYRHPRRLPPSFREVVEEQEEESTAAAWTVWQHNGAAQLPLFRAPRHHMKETFASTMIHPIAEHSQRFPGFAQASQDLRQIRPFRRLGVTIWDKWWMYSVGLLQDTGQTKKYIQTPDGDIIEQGVGQLSLYILCSRWLALVGKRPPYSWSAFDTEKRSELVW